MQTNYPTTTLYFVFAFTYCKLQVYTAQEPFIRKVLEANRVEFIEPTQSESWQEIDTRVLLDLVHRAMFKMLSDAGLAGKLKEAVAQFLCIQTLDSRPVAAAQR